MRRHCKVLTLNGNGVIDTSLVDTNGDGAPDTLEYLTPASILWDVETSYTGTNGQPYRPQNFDRQFHGPMSVRTALQNSYNVPAVRTLDYIGVSYFQQMATSMGLRFHPEAQFNLTTGSRFI